MKLHKGNRNTGRGLKGNQVFKPVLAGGIALCLAAVPALAADVINKDNEAYIIKVETEDLRISVHEIRAGSTAPRLCGYSSCKFEIDRIDQIRVVESDGVPGMNGDWIIGKQDDRLTIENGQIKLSHKPKGDAEAGIEGSGVDEAANQPVALIVPDPDPQNAAPPVLGVLPHLEEAGLEQPDPLVALHLPPPPRKAGSGGARVPRWVDIGASAPQVLSKVEPEYSEEARKVGYQGMVLLYLEVDPSGRARNARVARALGLGLDEQAIKAVRKWRFRPSFMDGKPLTVAATIGITFVCPERCLL